MVDWRVSLAMFDADPTDITDQPVDDLSAASATVDQLVPWLWQNSSFGLGTWCRGGGEGGGGSADDSGPWNSTCNDTGLSDLAPPAADVNYAAAVLVLIPLLTVFGNSLVIVSVIHEKSLRTVTNYFIVSLATSDVMVALLVMPLSIYGEV